MTRRIRALRERGDEGIATAEYAVATVGACGFAGVLYKLLTSDSVLALVTKVIARALNFAL